MSKNIIELKDVHTAFNGQKVHSGINLCIKEGEVMSLIGSSGVGKSVLLKELIGILKPDKGEILVMGTNIIPLKEEELIKIRRNIGILFQGSALFDSLTVYENIAYPLLEHMKLKEKEIKEKVREKLSLVGLEGVEEKMPDELSGGMKKRVGLARAIAVEPKIIMYDEPTTGIDPITAEKINELILSLQSKLGITTIVVTHDLHCVKKVTDRLAMLSEGKIITEGTWDEFENSEIKVIRDFIAGSRY
ncbi:MAG: ABC transporter ATP-binding protein [Candidatus Scalindua rubra]|uniref:ABC transporter ATP-binding protein n=1 Tax=Candidatus Scalindua rubra TaxID=1872076 RepID=A0A1E3XEE9_9BACT|nr:MAG: ABC transporter ATP-binding protein [Candidatus Scalindua rubra]